MRYQVRPLAIYEHRTTLRAEIVRDTDDGAGAKRHAEQHAQDWPDGLVVVDTVARTVDTGADVLPLAAFER